jgi:hypothetical protein
MDPPPQTSVGKKARKTQKSKTPSTLHSQRVLRKVPLHGVQCGSVGSPNKYTQSTVIQSQIRLPTWSRSSSGPAQKSIEFGLCVLDTFCRFPTRESGLGLYLYYPETRTRVYRSFSCTCQRSACAYTCTHKLIMKHICIRGPVLYDMFHIQLN